MGAGELAARIAQVRAGRGNPAALVGELRRAVLLVPVVDGGLMTADLGGVRWIHAFTDEPALARFAMARGAGPGEEWEYRAVLGARLLDAVIPALGGPAGIAVDAADEESSMLFPPVREIVPDAVAVDGADDGAGVGTGAGVVDGERAMGTGGPDGAWNGEAGW